jgi:hypothetical protein
MCACAPLLLLLLLLLLLSSSSSLVSGGFEFVWVPVYIIIIDLWQAMDERCSQTLLIYDDRLRLPFGFLKYNLSMYNNIKRKWYVWRWR